MPLPHPRHRAASRPSARSDSDYSGNWRWIKGAFTQQWLLAGGEEAAPSASRVAKGEHGVWQRRFWEQQIRDETDLERHVDYIHYNPVKHGHAARPADWPWSSFLRHVDLGQYPADWATIEPRLPTVAPAE
jgi:putative transposase